MVAYKEGVRVRVISDVALSSNEWFEYLRGDNSKSLSELLDEQHKNKEQQFS